MDTDSGDGNKNINKIAEFQECCHNKTEFYYGTIAADLYEEGLRRNEKKRPKIFFLIFFTAIKDKISTLVEYFLK